MVGRIRAAVAAMVLLALPSFVLGPTGAQTPTSTEPPNLAALVAAAAKEGTLELAVGASFGGPRGAQIVQDHLNRKYHINLTIHYAPISGGTAFIHQLVQEVRAGQPTSSDVMFTLTNSSIEPDVQRVDWRNYVPALPATSLVYDSHAVKVMAALVAFDYNTKLVPPGDVPKSYADFLKPEWKGKIASSPNQGTFLNYLGLPTMFGHQGMLDYIKKFNAQVGGLFVCGEIDRVVSGEFPLYGPDCGDHEVRLRQRKGEPIAPIYPKEGTELNYTVPAVPNTAAHPNAARLFIVYLLSREGQDDMWNLVGQDSDQLPGSHMAKVIADLRRQGVKIVEGASGTGLDLQHPELIQYASEISAIVNQGK